MQNAPALPSGSEAKPDAKTGSGLDLGPLQVGPIRGLVAGYSRTQITATFKPAAVGMVQRQVTLTFRQAPCLLDASTLSVLLSNHSKLFKPRRLR